MNLPGFIKSVSRPRNSRPVSGSPASRGKGASLAGADPAGPLLLSRRRPQCPVPGDIQCVHRFKKERDVPVCMPIVEV